MDQKTAKILQKINLHKKIKKILTIFSYIFIFFSILTYIFYGFNDKKQKFKLVSDFKKDATKFKTEKIMINPRISYKYEENQIYDIRAKKASHKTNQEVFMYDVYAQGSAGNISAGELKISENGDSLIFSQNPVLILNKK